MDPMDPMDLIDKKNGSSRYDEVFAMKRLMRWLALAAVPALAFAQTAPPAGTAMRAPDDKLIVFGSDNDFQVKYNSSGNRLEFVDAAGNQMLALFDGGTSGILSSLQYDIRGPGSYSTQMTSLATAYRAVVFPDAAGTVSLLGSGIESTEITDGTIVNADINASAAIAASKLAAGSSGQVLITSGSTPTWSTVASAGITDGTIVNADINSSAAIAVSKLAAGTEGYILKTVSGVPAWAAASSGSIGGTGPTTDNAIPRMDGTGGATLQGYSSNTPTIDDDGLMALPGGLNVTGQSTIGYGSDNTRPLRLVGSTSPAIQLYRGSASGANLRWVFGNSGGSESGTLTGNQFYVQAYDITGGYSHDALVIDANPAVGARFSGTAGTKRDLYVDGIYYAANDLAITNAAGKLVLGALDTTGASVGYVPSYNGSTVTWVAGSGNVSNAGSGTDNHVVRFNLTGTAVQDSNMVIDDSGNVTGVVGLTTTGTITAPASTTGLAPLNIPQGTAPSAPTNGDIWTTSAGLYARIAGATVGPYVSSTTATGLTDSQISDTLTIGASSTVADGALSSTVANLDQAETISGNWVNTANPWADNEVSDTLTIGSGSTMSSPPAIGGTSPAAGTFTTVTSTGNFNSTATTQTFIYNTPASGAANVRLCPLPSTTGDAADVDFFRQTNTSAAVNFNIRKGDNSSTSIFNVLAGSSPATTFKNSSGTTKVTVDHNTGNLTTVGTITAGSGPTVLTNSTGTIKGAALENSGVTAGTYNGLTVSAAGLVTAASNLSVASSTTVAYWDDFLGNALEPQWTNVTSGSGSPAATFQDAVSGNLKIISGTGTGSYDALKFGDYTGTVVRNFQRTKNAVAEVRLAASLLDSGDSIWLGFFYDDLPLQGALSNKKRACFSVNSGVFSDKWVCTTADGSATTNNATSTSPTGVQTLKIVLSSSNVKFYIDGSLLFTHTTNMPATTDNLYFCMQAYNSDAGTGSYLQPDYVSLSQDR